MKDVNLFYHFFRLAAAPPLLLSLLATGCDISTGDSAIRQVDIRIDGTYSREGGPLVTRNSGAAINSLTIHQDGDRLQGVDNNGSVFRGGIGQADAVTASITIRGMTTAGEEGTIVATVTRAGTEATMSGTWLEPALNSAVHGRARVPENGNDNGNDNGNENATGPPYDGWPPGLEPPPPPPS